MTGTDTDVGKTVVASAIAATLAAHGERVAVFKPAVTGLDEPDEVGAARPRAAARLRALAADRRPTIAPYRFGPPVSPHLAAALRGHRRPAARASWRPRAAPPRRRRADRGGRRRAAGAAARRLSRARLRRRPRPAARDRRAARPRHHQPHAADARVRAARPASTWRAVVLTPWPAQPGEMERSNLETIARLGGVEVATLPALAVRTIGPAALRCRWHAGSRASAPRASCAPPPDQYGCRPPFGLTTWPVV